MVWGPSVSLPTLRSVELAHSLPGLSCHFESPATNTPVLSHSVLSGCLRPHGLYPPSLLRPRGSPGKSTRVSCHFLLQGIFPTQGLNPGLLHCRQILYHLRHQGMRIKLGKHVGCLKPAQKRSADQALLTHLHCGAGDPHIRGWRRRTESQETSVSASPGNSD